MITLQLELQACHLRFQLLHSLLHVFTMCSQYATLMTTLHHTISTLTLGSTNRGWYLVLAVRISVSAYYGLHTLTLLEFFIQPSFDLCAPQHSHRATKGREE